MPVCWGDSLSEVKLYLLKTIVYNCAGLARSPLLCYMSTWLVRYLLPPLPLAQKPSNDVLACEDPITPSNTVKYHPSSKTLIPTEQLGGVRNWRASAASETLSGVYKFELVRYIYVWRYVCHNSSACHAYVMWVELGHCHFLYIPAVLNIVTTGNGKGTKIVLKLNRALGFEFSIQSSVYGATTVAKVSLFCTWTQCTVSFYSM